MTVSYVIRSHWNASTSRLHGRSYASQEEALDAIGSHIVDPEAWSDTDGEGRDCTAIGVYADEEDLAANAEGGAPHLCLAVVQAVPVRP